MKKSKIVIILSVVFVLISITIVLLCFSKKRDYLSIEIASKYVHYTYSPNGGTFSDLKKGNIINLKIISNKKNRVKCYSTNENIIFFEDANNIGLAKNVGETSIYCKLGKIKSNEIFVKVGN